MNDQTLYTCPGCGYKTRSSEYFGSYDICPICDWEDDSVQLHNPACGGGANKISLIETQNDLLTKKIQHNKYEKDPLWRPLTSEEIEIAQKEKLEKYWKNIGDTEYAKAYWLR